MSRNYDFKQFQHDLKTYLNHIIGYCDILKAEAVQYKKVELISNIEQIAQKSEKIKQLLDSIFKQQQSPGKKLNTEEIRKTLYLPLVQIISDSRRLIVLFKNNAPNFVNDMEQLFSVAHKMHAMVESELIELQIQEIAENTPASSPDGLNSLGGAAFDQEQLNDLDFDSDISPPANGSARILVIDDNVTYHRLISRHLNTLGHSVDCIESGTLVLEYLSKHPIDIIVLDVVMPDISGYNILRMLKQNPVFSSIPVIMISALDSSSSVAQCIKLGAEDYLPKDFDPIILRARINACIEKKMLQAQQDMFVQAIVESQRKLSNELSDAARYIVSLLPRPLFEPVKAAVALIPSAQLGGDFCGYHWIDPSNLAIYLLDVSGHGIKSALLAVSLSNTIRTQGLPEVNFHDPGMVLSSLNKTFQTTDYNTVFFSLWYGVYNTGNRTLIFASGGSPPACVIRKNKPDDFEILESRDLVLGAAEEYQYQNKQTSFAKGDRLVLYSDGLYEISRRDGSILGLTEFQKLLPMYRDEPANNIARIMESALSLTLNDAFQDDISLLEIQF